MAITILTRPREYVYTNNGSPAVQVFATWSAGWNPIVYTLSVPTTADVASAILLNIYEVGSNTLLASNTYRPFQTGNLNIDIGPFLRAYLFSKYDPDFSTEINSSDAGNDLGYYITYTQAFDNGDPSIFNSEISKPMFASCSAMQFGDSHAGNMVEYTPFQDDLPEDSKMRFLTEFEKPVMWQGWPFSLSFIFGIDMIGTQILSREIQENINGIQLVQTDNELDPNQVGHVNYLKVSEPTDQNARKTIVSLRTGNTIANYYVTPGYVAEGYVQIL